MDMDILVWIVDPFVVNAADIEVVSSNYRVIYKKHNIIFG